MQSNKEKRAELIQRANALLENKPFSKEDSAKFSSYMTLADAILDSPEVITTDENRSRESTDLRNYLIQGKESRTYAGLNIATDSAGGFYVPQSFYTSVTAALKQADGLWDDSVITMFEDTHGNSLTCALVDDTATSAVLVAEAGTSIEAEIPVIDRLLLPKIPTWRTKKLAASLEILMDSAFPVESAIIVPAVAGRFQRGISAANVATLISAITSGATSAAPTAVTIDDTLALLRSVNPAWLASSKAFFGMNYNTLVTLLSEKSSLSGNYQWKPRTDANGRMLLHNIPVVLMPSLPSATANAQGTVVLGDLSRCIRRVVKNSLTILRYSDAPGLAEFGIFAFEGFLRTSFGVLASASSDSPIKFLTQHA